MSEIHDFRVGDRVRVRPFFLIPQSAQLASSCRSPYLYPGTIKEVISLDGPGIVVELDPHQFHQLWEFVQAFTPAEIHRHNCSCEQCRTDSRHCCISDPLADITTLTKRLERLQVCAAPIEETDLVLDVADRTQADEVIWINHAFSLAGIAAMLAFAMEYQHEGPPPQYRHLTRHEAELLLGQALSYGSLDATEIASPATSPQTRTWADAQARRLFGRSGSEPEGASCAEASE